MSELAKEGYLKENTSEIKVDKYTFRVASHFRKNNAPSADEIAKLLVQERVSRTFASSKASALS